MTEFGWLTNAAPVGTVTWKLNMHSEILYANRDSVWILHLGNFEQLERDLLDEFRGNDS